MKSTRKRGIFAGQGEDPCLRCGLGLPRRNCHAPWGRSRKRLALPVAAVESRRAFLNHAPTGTHYCGHSSICDKPSEDYRANDGVEGINGNSGSGTRVGVFPGPLCFQDAVAHSRALASGDYLAVENAKPYIIGRGPLSHHFRLIVRLSRALTSWRWCVMRLEPIALGVARARKPVKPRRSCSCLVVMV